MPANKVFKKVRLRLRQGNKNPYSNGQRSADKRKNLLLWLSFGSSSKKCVRVPLWMAPPWREGGHKSHLLELTPRVQAWSLGWVISAAAAGNTERSRSWTTGSFPVQTNTWSISPRGLEVDVQTADWEHNPDCLRSVSGAFDLWTKLKTLKLTSSNSRSCQRLNPSHHTASQKKLFAS